jgi:hypothetical protein
MRSTITNVLAVLSLAAPLSLTACVDDAEPLDDDDALVDAGADDESLDESKGDVASALPPGCELHWNYPEYYPGTVGGWGGWSGCPSTAQVTVRLRWDKSWYPDETLATWTATGSSGGKALSRTCYNDGRGMDVFVEVIYGSEKRSSPRVHVPCRP